MESRAPKLLPKERRRPARRGWGMLVGIPALTGASATFLLAAGLFLTPASPLALGRADAMLGQGMPLSAARQYEAIGATSPVLSLRKTAYRRAARVWELELDQPAEAQRALKQLLRLGVEPTEQGDVREQLAELYLAEHDPRAAAHQYRLSYDADRTHPERLVRAAELRAGRGEFVRARNLWVRLRDEHPETWGARANLGLGELALAQGRPAQALDPFQAASHSHDEALAKAARLGLAACYERLGELDGAMAELDLADLPEGVRSRRKSALIERRAVQKGAEDDVEDTGHTAEH